MKMPSKDAADSHVTYRPRSESPSGKQHYAAELILTFYPSSRRLSGPARRRCPAAPLLIDLPVTCTGARALELGAFPLQARSRSLHPAFTSPVGLQIMGRARVSLCRSLCLKRLLQSTGLQCRSQLEDAKVSQLGREERSGTKPLLIHVRRKPSSSHPAHHRGSGLSVSFNCSAN